MDTPRQLPKIGVRDLSTDTIEALDKITRPTTEEIAGMVQSICRRKLWSRSRFAALLCIQPHDLAKIEAGESVAHGPLVRLIWLFYTLDTAPEQALDQVYVAMWGKLDDANALPKQSHERLKGEMRTLAINWLQSLRHQPGYKRPLTLLEISEHLKVSYPTARKLCKEIKYRYSKKRKKTLPFYLKPNSKWLRVDWRKSDKVIAEETLVGVQRVDEHRRFFRHIAVRALKRHLAACGIENYEEKFEPIFKKRVKKQHGNRVGRRFIPAPREAM